MTLELTMIWSAVVVHLAEGPDTTDYGFVREHHPPPVINRPEDTILSEFEPSSDLIPGEIGFLGLRVLYDVEDLNDRIAKTCAHIFWLF